MAALPAAFTGGGGVHGKGPGQVAEAAVAFIHQGHRGRPQARQLEVDSAAALQGGIVVKAQDDGPNGQIGDGEQAGRAADGQLFHIPRRPQPGSYPGRCRRGDLGPGIFRQGGGIQRQGKTSLPRDSQRAKALFAPQYSGKAPAAPAGQLHGAKAVGIGGGGQGKAAQGCRDDCPGPGGDCHRAVGSPQPDGAGIDGAHAAAPFRFFVLCFIGFLSPAFRRSFGFRRAGRLPPAAAGRSPG